MVAYNKTSCGTHQASQAMRNSKKSSTAEGR
jgi:hypothetical protein